VTRAEWQASIVERTLANDWPTDPVQKGVLIIGPCEYCDLLMEELPRINSGYLRHFACRCLGLRRTAIAGLEGPEWLPECPRCHTSVGAKEVSPPLSEWHWNKALFKKADGVSITCQCGYMRTKA
jgi:hypothetical protein